ncbi:ATP-binding cassette sub-family G member 4 [Cimex lectularius]|uniref:ABC transporter domain-containing protein n=1 Tax=Cimex lectularius TaxID=79782 RepID=A0A8I6RLA9_CIMLE|nr:ATP-binding cassette sub-family G member 4 [Cimex lectularius]XP_014247465.1 ATP-binding cassette sub-family G member 4 [Cimex lectularius]XP_014247466.1 ATP-binding cassette sub-family G member 4 [Cimex lectularius]
MVEDGAIEEIPLKTRPALTYTRLPATEPVEIRFQDLQYRASLGFRKGTKEILHNVHGRFLPAQLIAIMGPSGAGKSTLLDVLSGYRITGVRGIVTVNGRERDLDEFRRVSCYITQDDRLQLLLTVKENMKVAADLKFTAKYTEEEKWAIIDEILKMLGLYECSKTRAGQLSGGQKKRLSIALELVNNPLVMFLDEPTTGLDSASCLLCIKLMKQLVAQGRTVVCTIHQPSASLFQNFDHVYVLAEGECLYQGSSTNLVPYLEHMKLPCPKYHNPADFVIELACGEHGKDKIKTLVHGTQNGRSIQFFENADQLPPTTHVEVSHKSPRLPGKIRCTSSLQDTSQMNQLSVIITRGFVKVMRDSTLTYMRIVANLVTGFMLGLLYYNSGVDGSRVLDNYNLLFSILIHHSMSTMMLTILTFPMEMSILIKEHFNRWYSLKSYYIMVNIVDIPVAAGCCIVFTIIIYLLSGQPLSWERFSVFLVLSLLVVFIAQSIGYIVGAVFNSVVNGTFAGPILIVPMMMFSGFGVNFRDIPEYLRWGTHLSFLRYSLEGYVGAIYGMDRGTLPCNDHFYCHYKYPDKFMYDVAMKGDVYMNCIIILIMMLIFTKVVAYILLRWKIRSLR